MTRTATHTAPVIPASDWSTVRIYLRSLHLIGDWSTVRIYLLVGLVLGGRQLGEHLVVRDPRGDGEPQLAQNRRPQRRHQGGAARQPGVQAVVGVQPAAHHVGGRRGRESNLGENVGGAGGATLLIRTLPAVGSGGVRGGVDLGGEVNVGLVDGGALDQWEEALEDLEDLGARAAVALQAGLGGGAVVGGGGGGGGLVAADGLDVHEDDLRAEPLGLGDAHPALHARGPRRVVDGDQSWCMEEERRRKN
eukprot:408197-Prorocentrum_minimum.AAC.2